jgi:N-acetylmuramoyl-L-alanine amidase
VPQRLGDTDVNDTIAGSQREYQHLLQRQRKVRLLGVSTLVPAWHRGWTDDIYARSARAGRALQAGVTTATGAANRGVLQRSDLTGFNWADVPAVLVETGFMTNPTESRRLKTGAYQQRVALGLVRGVDAFLGR